MIELVYHEHVITTKGFKPDPYKIAVVVDWPCPITIKQIKGFLGLTSYCRHFISRYVEVATPIIDLLKKRNHTWTEEAITTFNHLKLLLTTSPLLAYPNFSAPFVIETNAYKVGIGAVLSQQHPIAYFSKKLLGRC